MIQALIMFCEACWKAVVVVVGIPHHGHVNSTSTTFAKKELKNKLKIQKSDNICWEKKKKVVRLRSEVSCLLPDFWPLVLLSTDMELERAGLSSNQLSRELKSCQ